MHRLVAALATVVFLASGSAALAAGPSYVAAGGLGVLAPDGKTRYVALPTGNKTVIARLTVHGGAVRSWADLDGSWGLPAPTSFARSSEGLSRDGKTLIVGRFGAGSPSRFLVVDTRLMRSVDSITLDGDYAYDALSPDASTLYLIQHVDANNINRYVVRAYDLRTHTLRPGRIADKTQSGWVMEGTAVTRTSSGDGRMVYTMYSRPGGYPFIHALDTVSGSAHCIGLPWHGNQTPLFNARLELGGDGGTLAVRMKDGRTWLTVNTSNWRLTHVQEEGGRPWHWPVAGAGVAAALAIALALTLFARRRHPREAAAAAL